eukprot:gene3665-13738_t
MIDKERMAQLGFGVAPSLVNRINNFFSQPMIDKERMAKLGFGAFSAYVIISNVNAIILIIIAWVSVVNATGCKPLLEANRARFVAVYAGLWVSSHLLSPIRLSLAIASAPTMDKYFSASVWVSSHSMRPIRLSLAIAAAPTMDKVGPV